MLPILLPVPESCPQLSESNICLNTNLIFSFNRQIFNPKVSNGSKFRIIFVQFRTSMGRARAWLRLALMQKKLSDYFRLLLDNREVLLTDFYEDNALMMSDEAIVIGGLLVGLNILDCNLCVKEEDLDYQHSVIDFSLYLKDNIQPNTLEYKSLPDQLDNGYNLSQYTY